MQELRADEPSSAPEPKPRAPEPKPHEEPMLFCPNCSTRLTEKKCKLICEQCGYYLSCADYY
jgi:hypothetical protein